MKFGLFTHIPWPEGKEPKQVLDETTEEIVYAEEVGFHSAWVAEHHFSRYGLGSSSLVFSASVAAQTKKIRLGTAILVPPLHRPVRTELPTSNEVLYDRRAIIGTPEQCVAQIKELQGHGIEYFGCNFSFGGMDQGKLLRSMKLFAEEVMPHFN